MSQVEIIRVTDGHNATIVSASGILTKEDESFDLVHWAELKPVPVKARLESAAFGIQEKAGVLLWWKMPDGKNRLILPLESRGKLDFEGLQGIHAPPTSLGICMTTFGVPSPKHFRLSIDLTKQF